MAQHLAMPLRISATGALAGVVADSADDMAQRLALLLSTRPGERLSVPTYGTPAVLFSGVNVRAVTAAIDTWEPGAGDYDVQVAGTPSHPVLALTLSDDAGTDTLAVSS